jgi:branched-chain amino acid transport system permease protein
MTGRTVLIRRLVLIAFVVAYLLATRGVGISSLYTQSVVLTAAVFAILAVSLDMVAGMVGLYSLGHAGLFALGAYATTLLNEKKDWGVFTILPVTLIGCALIGVVLGALSLRVSGLYFAITTFVFTLVVGVLASDLKITGGMQGLPGPLFPDFPDGLSNLGTAVVWCVSLCLLVTLALAWSIRRSALYPVLLAIRDAEPFAAANGVRPAVVKVAMFALSAALAGLAGWAFSFLGFVSPSQFSWTVSVNILVMVIIGGINTTIGPVVGAAFISVFPVYVHIDPLLQELLFGAIFILVIVFAPRGVLGLLDRIPLVRRLTARAPVVAAASPAQLEPAGPAVGSAADAPFAVRCQAVSFSYLPGTPVLREVDFAVRRGTIHGLIGPNGSGKSTLVNLIAGQLAPAAGSIEINGQRVDRLGAAARPHHGLMRTFQTAVLVRELPARQNVAIGLYSAVPRIGLRALAWPALPGAHRDDRAISRRAAGALAGVGMGGWAGTRVADVPHGVEQLVQLAAATAAGPSVLLLDEPLAGLSVAEVDQVGAVLHDLKAAGASVIVIEHQTKFIFDLCDEVTVLAAGELVTSGPAAEVRADTRVREVYLGQ